MLVGSSYNTSLKENRKFIALSKLQMNIAWFLAPKLLQRTFLWIYVISSKKCVEEYLLTLYFFNMLLFQRRKWCCVRSTEYTELSSTAHRPRKGLESIATGCSRCTSQSLALQLIYTMSMNQSVLIRTLGILSTWISEK